MSRVFLFLILLLSFATQVSGEVWFIEPTPYQSPADSPFDLSNLGTTFFIEDLEDGEIDPRMNTAGLAIRGPGPFTDSVDSDDGVIDGDGRGGHSLESTGFITQLTNPLSHISTVQFNFPLSGPSYNSFGFVWTDVLQSELPIPAIGLDFHVFVDGDAPEVISLSPTMDLVNTGETAEDLFIGAIADGRIRSIMITQRSTGDGPLSERFELDHIQFGTQTVPEPNLGLGACWAFVVLFSLRRRRICDGDKTNGRAS
jgi:hypothetical protein